MFKIQSGSVIDNQRLKSHTKRSTTKTTTTGLIVNNIARCLKSQNVRTASLFAICPDSYKQIEAG